MSDSPVESAQFMCNKHIPKMVVETAQILSTVSRSRGVPAPYKSTHSKHPSTIWAGFCDSNYAWLLEHGFALCGEFEKRFGKVHKTFAVMQQLLDDFNKVWPYCAGRSEKHTPFAMAMPPEWKCSDPIIAYRAYYIADKSRFARWEPRARRPHWWPFEHEEVVCE